MATEFKSGLKKAILLFAAFVILCGRLSALTPDIPNISITPASFGLLKSLDDQKGLTAIRFLNEGNDPVIITGITHSNPAFEIAPTSFDLMSGVPQEVNVTFTPRGYGIFSDSLIIATSTGARIVYKIKGIGVTSPSPSMGLSAKEFAFGDIKTGNTVKKTLIVTNFGVDGVDMVINGITLNSNTGSAFSVTPQSRTIAACDSAAFEVTFNPLQTGVYNVSMTLNSNAKNKGDLIQLSGKGVSGVSPVCEVSRATLYFGAVRAGQQAEQDLIIKNTGSDDLTVSSISSDNTSFAVDAKTFTVASNESKTVKITFAPQSEGTFDNKLIINHNAASSPAYVYLNGSSFNYSPTITLNTNISFADVADIKNYRMIGLPGNIDLPISQVFTGRAEFDWNAVWDNGQSTNYKIKYDGTSKFNFRPGNAFWLISKNPMKVSKTVSPVTLTAANDYSITLSTGWNLISNPFDKDVNWADVRLANSLPANAVIYAWNGSYSQSTVFAPYQGYYFYNQPGLASLKIPYKTSSALSKSEAGNSINQLTIEAENELVAVPPLRLGLNKNASDDYDESDYLMPPGDFESAGIRLYSSRLSTDYKYLSCEMRPGNNDGEVFDLKVKNETGRNLILRIKGADQFAGREIYLSEKGISRFTDLKACSELTVPANHKNRDYSVIIGSRKFIEAMQMMQVPDNFSVMQNYPNPFNPSTSIKYSLPQASRVEINIYNILGEQIAQLKNAVEDAGSYEVIWDARSFSSGVYLYSVKAETADGAELFRDVKKMVMIK